MTTVILLAEAQYQRELRGWVVNRRSTPLLAELLAYQLGVRSPGDHIFPGVRSEAWPPLCGLYRPKGMH